MSNPTAQITLMGPDATAAVQPEISIEVDDVDAMHAAMVEAGAEIVHPLQDESWGGRRFFVVDPNGRVVNVVGHRCSGLAARRPARLTEQRLDALGRRIEADLALGAT